MIGLLGLLLTKGQIRDNASLVLREYLESVGGREKILEETEAAATQKSAKKRGRPAGSSGTPASGKRTKRGSHPASQTPPASVSSKEWKPPAGSWENDVAFVDACHDENTGKLLVYLTWRNGHKTQHDLKVVYSRCPQQVRMHSATMTPGQVGSKANTAHNNRCSSSTNVMSRLSRPPRMPTWNNSERARLGRAHENFWDLEYREV